MTRRRTTSARHWSATIFDVDTDPNTWPDVDYAAWQKEKADGKEHLQLYVRFTKRMRMTAVQALVKARWEHTRNPQASRDYCMKADTRVEGPWEIGTWTKTKTQGCKFKAVMDMIDSGKDEAYICRATPGLYGRYSTGIRRMVQILSPPRTEEAKTQMLWIWGPQGSGKTTYAKKLAKERGYYLKDGTHKWWPNYKGQKVSIIDDFKGAMVYSSLMQMCGNGGEYLVQTKGGFLQFTSREVIITSIKHPRFVYKEELWPQGMERRVKGRTIYMEAKVPYKTDFVGNHEYDTPVVSKLTAVIDPCRSEATGDFWTQYRKISQDRSNLTGL